VLSVPVLERIRARTSPQAIVTMGMCLFSCMIAGAAPGARRRRCW
jgi:hypothetical protein